MMKVLCGAVLSALLLAAGQVGAACQWPAWEQFKTSVRQPRGTGD